MRLSACAKSGRKGERYEHRELNRLNHFALARVTIEMTTACRVSGGADEHEETDVAFRGGTPTASTIPGTTLVGILRRAATPAGACPNTSRGASEASIARELFGFVDKKAARRRRSS